MNDILKTIDEQKILLHKDNLYSFNNIVSGNGVDIGRILTHLPKNTSK